MHFCVVSDLFRLFLVIKHLKQIQVKKMELVAT